MKVILRHQALTPPPSRILRNLGMLPYGTLLGTHTSSRMWKLVLFPICSRKSGPYQGWNMLQSWVVWEQSYLDMEHIFWGTVTRFLVPKVPEALTGPMHSSSFAGASRCRPSTCLSLLECSALVQGADEFNVVFKVETHNHPSALEPLVKHNSINVS